MVTEEEVLKKIEELEVVKKIYEKERANADIERYFDFYNTRLSIIEEHITMLNWFIGKVSSFELHWENKEWLTLQRM
jgi:hypothetical protein